MKNKTLRIVSLILIIIIVSMLTYVFIGTKRLEKLTVEHLKNKGYVETDYELKVKHSFLNIILSYNEWGVNVIYNDEKEATYIFTLRDGKIVESGVTGKVKKEDLKHKD